MIKDGERRVSLRFHLAVFDVDPGKKDFVGKRVGAKKQPPEVFCKNENS